MLDITATFNVPWIASGVCGVAALLVSIPLFMKKREDTVLDDDVNIVDVPLTQCAELKETDA